MKKLWQNLTTSNGAFDHSLELQKKAIILNSSMIFVFLVFFPLSIRGLLYRDIYIFSTMELLTSFVLLYLIYFLRTKKKIDFVAIFVTTMLTMLLALYLYIEKGSNDSFIWIPPLLFFVFFLRGFKQGIIIASILGVYLFSLMAYFYIDENNSFTIVSYLNIAFAYFIFIAILITYHNLLKNAENKLIEANSSLEIRVQEATDQLNKQHLMLIQKSKMEDLGETFGMLSHQLRQPLTVMMLDADELIEKKDIDIEKKEALANNIKKRLYFMADTISTFKKFMNPHTKDSNFSVYSAVSQIASFLEHTFKIKSIELVINKNIEDDTIFGNENAFKQVMLNTLTNASDSIIEAKRKDGKIFIDISKTDKIKLIIKDNGTGLKTDKAFEVYSTTKGEKGTGLGLYMSKLIIEKMGGEIAIYSNPDRGATVEITI